MHVQITDPPQHPLPQHPQPLQPQVAHTHPPMVYVYEKQRWEYRVVQGAMAENELNALGSEGWELVGVMALPENTQFYFKRACP